jgi:hypothetical protein
MLYNICVRTKFCVKFLQQVVIFLNVVLEIRDLIISEHHHIFSDLGSNRVLC